MTWAKGDDRYDDRPKIKKAWRMSGYAVGLHWQAVTASCRHESDGLVDPEWLADKLAVIPAREAKKALDTLLKLELFERLSAGESRELTDKKGFTVQVGPLDEDVFIVHDFLEYNDSSAYLTARRERDAKRKADQKPSLRPDSTRSPRGIQTESKRSPSDPPVRPRAQVGSGGVGDLDVAVLPDHARAASPLANAVHESILILSQCERLYVDQVGVENAVAAWPHRDPVLAARTVVTWATDPGFRATNAASLLAKALSKQEPSKPNGDLDNDTSDFSKYDRVPAPARRTA